MWTEYLTMTLPYTEANAEIAAKLGRAFDPDIAGHLSFTRTITGYDGETPVYGDTLTCRTGCTAEFKAQALAMLGNAAMLHHVVQTDYAARWPELTPPTLSECEAFLAVVEAV